MRITRSTRPESLLDLMGPTATLPEAVTLLDLLRESGAPDTESVDEAQWNALLDLAARTNRTLAARALGARGGAARTPAQAEAGRANGRRGGRPVVLGTISVEGGRATVRYAPGLGRVECVLPDGTVEVPEEASVSSLEEVRQTAAAWYGRDRLAWDWQPADRPVTIARAREILAEELAAAGWRADTDRLPVVAPDGRGHYSLSDGTEAEPLARTETALRRQCRRWVESFA